MSGANPTVALDDLETLLVARIAEVRAEARRGDLGTRYFGLVGDIARLLEHSESNLIEALTPINSEEAALDR